MYTKILERETLQMIKRGFLNSTVENLLTIVNECFENSYDSILDESNPTYRENFQYTFRQRLLQQKNHESFVDSDLNFDDLTDAIENSIYMIAFYLIEENDINYSDNDDYTIEDNTLYKKLIDDYSMRAVWNNLSYNKETDILTINTSNIFGINTSIDIMIFKINDKGYISNLLLMTFKKIMDEIVIFN